MRRAESRWPSKRLLSELREVVWTHWDPIGLASELETETFQSPIDEYDSYIMVAIGMIARGEDDDAAAGYLLYAETEHMGLRFSDDDLRLSDFPERRRRVDMVARELRKCLDDGSDTMRASGGEV